MRKKNIIRKPPTEVHTYRCTKEELKQLQTLAKECGISLSRYVVETGLKHRPRMRLTKEEVDALNSLAIARTDLIKISNVLSKKTAEEKARFFKMRSSCVGGLMPLQGLSNIGIALKRISQQTYRPNQRNNHDYARKGRIVRRQFRKIRIGKEKAKRSR